VVAGDLPVTDETPLFVISVAAELAGMHPQTLRQYDRLGLVTPSRTRGGGRRYCGRDVEMLREIQRLSQDGVSLTGIKRILELQTQVLTLEQRVLELEHQTARAELMTRSLSRVFAAGPGGEVVSVLPGRRPARPESGADSALVVWRPQPDSTEPSQEFATE
jgi:MerR family transcriptional regulator, heat shock protein HspR